MKANKSPENIADVSIGTDHHVADAYYLSASIEEIHDMLFAAYRYLLQSASSKGHWEEARCTALAAMCLQLRADGTSPWLAAVRNWIIAHQSVDANGYGSWGEELWDTSMCVIALKDLHVSTRAEVIESATQWMASLFSVNGRENWHDEPWETSWALLAVLRAGRVPSQIRIGPALNWLSSLQDAQGKIVAPHYTAYLLLISSLAAKVDLREEDKARLTAASLNCVRYLLAEIETADPAILWTGEPWSNGQILWALASTKHFPVRNQATTSKVITWFAKNQLELPRFGGQLAA